MGFDSEAVQTYFIAHYQVDELNTKKKIKKEVK